MSAQAKLVPRQGSSLWVTRQDVAQKLSHLTGSKRRRFPYDPAVSPTRVMGLRMRKETPEQRMRYIGLVKKLARQTNERLPLVTLQALLRREDFQQEESLAKIVRDFNPTVWRDRLNSLATRGWTEEDIDHWVWILSGDDGDARIRRFVFTERRKPVFLLKLLLQSDQIIRSPESLKMIMSYVNKMYCAPNPNLPTIDYTLALRPPPNDPIHALRPMKFLVVLRRLTRHVMRLWPRALPSLAQLTRQYIENIPVTRNGRGKGYHDRCLVFNTVLLYFGKQTPREPFLNMEFNWRAQKVLLAMSHSMKPQLTIDKSSYRAIRKVMIAQRKSAAERGVAMRYAKSWPPYRQDYDRHDEIRTAEDDHSRSVKVGTLMREAGYEEDDYDRALGALGGSTDGSPSIQDRSLAPKNLAPNKSRKPKKGMGTDNFFQFWAMKVRSTRNAQEAWRMFNVFSDAEPTLPVYHEMLLKLQAREVDPTASLLPGDSKETWPVYDANLSRYERARLTPPSVQELYSQMISRGIKPEGLSLDSLVSNAGSVEDGMQYLRDSGIDPVSVSHLALFKDPALQHVYRVPLWAYNSFIQLLCRLQPTRLGKQRLPTDKLHRVRHAIKLAKLRYRPGTVAGATFKSPFQAIARTLARPYVAVMNGELIDNDAEALKILLDVYAYAEKAGDIDPELFVYLCRTLQKLAVSRLDLYYSNSTAVQSQALPLIANTKLGGLVKDGIRKINSTFQRMIAETKNLDIGFDLPKSLHVVQPVQLHQYMRTLAFLENMPAMVSLMDWIFKNKAIVDGETARHGSRGLGMMAKTLCVFEAYAGPQLDFDTRERLDARMELITESDPAWRWPTSKEIEDYIKSDERGWSQKLHQKVIAQWWQHAPEADRQELEREKELSGTLN